MVLAVDASASSRQHGKSLLVVRGWGRDGPGIVRSFIKVVVDHQCEVVDISQFLLEGSFMFTLALQVCDRSSMLLMKSLQTCANEKKMQLGFHFPDCSDVHNGCSEHIATVSVVSASALAPKLFHDLDVVLAQHKCVVLDVEHRNDNKKEINGEYNKVQLRISCPHDAKMSDIYLGTTGSMPIPGLQSTAQQLGAEVTMRWWDALNRPNGKSLVVFGLSHVLCPYDVLDELIAEAGVSTGESPAGESTSQQNRRKVKLLKGKHSDVIQRVIARLLYTPGARLVCNVLKRMGFRLAVLTNTGCRDIAEHVKNQLGMDYVICRDLEVQDGYFTGDYIGELTDINFRKADLLKLLAERDGISDRNVIVVGAFLKGLKIANAKAVLEAFGPNVLFNSNRHKDLTIALYLLGFHGSDLQNLRKRKWINGPGSTAGLESPIGDIVKNRLILHVSSRVRMPGQMSSIFKCISSQSGVRVRTLRQCSLHDGGVCVGLDLGLPGDTDGLAKELIYACHHQGFSVMQLDSIHAMSFLGDRNVGKTSATWWKSVSRNYVITLVEQPNISCRSLEALLGLLSEMKVNVIRMDRLSVTKLAALHFLVSIPKGMDPATLKTALGSLAVAHDVDIAFQKDDVERSMRRLVVFDMDSTLIQQEVIDELAKLAGVEDQVKVITESAMNGEIDFFDSLQRRVALLKGHKAEELFHSVKSNLIYTPGAKKLCSTLKRLGYKLAVISGGFQPVAEEVKRHLKLDYAFANTLEVDDTTGLLTGQTFGPVVTPQRKKTLLATIASVEGCGVEQTIAVGDGANDIPMLNTAGLGIAFCAKPKVQAVTEFRINQKDLSTVLFLVGVSEHAVEHLT